MANQESFPVGQAPWEQGGSSDPHPDTFPVGKAPWDASPDESGGILSSVGKGVEKYWSAPIRAAIGAAQHGENPLTAEDKQFGADPALAPTEGDLGANLGLSRERKLIATAEQQRAFDKEHNPNLVAITNYQDKFQPSNAETAGKFIAAAADPLNYIPGGGEIEGGEKIAAGAARLAEGAGDTLKSAAEGAMVNASGATASQAAKFDESAGRYILDNKVGRFGDSQAKIAQRAAQQMDEANQQISTSLQKLQGQGVTVKASDVEDALNERINALKSDPSNADIVKRLQSEIENLKATGKAEFGIHDAEMVKRGYNRKAGNWADPESAMAGKEAYQAWRGAVEDAATKANPQLADQFKAAKKSYGILAPIQEAAERRALVQHQAPIGDFRDLMTGEIAERAGGPFAAIPAMVARHVVVPRIASTVAVGLDTLGDAVKAAPSVISPASKASPALGAASAFADSRSPISLLPAAASNQPTKGPDKWANDGVKKLIDHVSDEKTKSEILNQKGAMLQDPAVKNLLIQASDLKPGAPAMDAILTKVKAKIAQGDD